MTILQYLTTNNPPFLPEGVGFFVPLTAENKN